MNRRSFLNFLALFPVLKFPDRPRVMYAFPPAIPLRGLEWPSTQAYRDFVLSMHPQVYIIGDKWSGGEE